MRYPLAGGATFSFTVLASVPATGVAADPGPVRFATTSISYGRIDMSNYAYFLQCKLGTETGIVGADIQYTISATNG